MINDSSEFVELTIWDREFSLPVYFDCYKDEKILDIQIESLKVFCEHSEWLSKSKHVVVRYCFNAVLKDDGNTQKDNIFSYIKPESIYVKREEKPRVALLCKYRYELEHGLALIFSSDGEVTIGSQDMIL